MSSAPRKIAGAARFRLRYQSQEMPLQHGPWTIGRSSDCDIVLDDQLISRRHAVLHVREDSLVLEDLGSQNGVMINGKRGAPKTPVRDGDAIRIGRQTFVVVDGEARASREQPTLSHGQAFAAESSSGVVRALPDRQVGEPDDVFLERVTAAALSLAESSGDPKWIDQLLVLYTLRSRMPDAMTVSALIRLAGTGTFRGGPALDAFIERMHKRKERLAAVDRVLLRKLGEITDRA